MGSVDVTETLLPTITR